MRILRNVSVLLLGLIVLAGGFIGYKSAYRPGLEAYEAHRYVNPPISAGARALSATWFGTTAVLLSDGEASLLVDPFFTRPEGWLRMLSNREIAPDPEKIARWLVQARVENLLAVLVSHSHHDHAMDAGVVSQITDATLVGSESTANIGRGVLVAESQIRIVKHGAPMKFGGFTVTFFESRHAGATGGRPAGDIAEPLVSPARYLDYKQGGTYSILVEHALGRVLFHGSAGYAPDMLKGRKADVAFLGIALLDDLDAYLEETVDAVGATRVIPTHWDDFTRSLDEPPIPNLIGVRLERFFEDMARLRPRVQVQTLKLGEPAALFAATAPMKREPAPNLKKP